MKKFFLVALITSSLTHSIVQAAEANVAADKVLVTFSGGEVKESQVMKYFKNALQSQPNLKDKKFSEFDPNIQKNLVQGYLNTQLLEKEAKTSPIANSAAFKKRIESFRKQILQKEIVDEYVNSHLTEDVMNAEYEKLKKDLTGKEEIKTSHILVESEEQAKKLKQKLSKGGAKFEDVAKEFSIDENSKNQGGQLDYFIQGQLVPEYEKKAFSMKKGQISDPVKSPFGWHIIKLEDKRKVVVPTKEEAKQQIKDKKSNELVNEFFNSLEKKYQVKFLTDLK